MLIKLDYLTKKYKVTSRGVIHVGASEGQEASMYPQFGINKMIFVEAIPAVFEKLKANIARYPEAVAVNACVSDVDEAEIDFNVASNGGQSSSFLEFGLHSKMHPQVTYVEKIRLKTKRLDTLLAETPAFGPDFDFLNMDLQGAELFALRGMGLLMHQIRYLYLEVNKRELYKGCALVGEIDEFLHQYGFKRVETKWTSNYWGDAFYTKK